MWARSVYATVVMGYESGCAGSRDYELWTIERGMLWCCDWSAFALQTSCVPHICRYWKEQVSSVYAENVFPIMVFCYCVLFMQLEGCLQWESTPSCFWNCTLIRMLTGGAERERERRHAVSPDLFHVSKYIHLLSNITCSSMKIMKYIYIAM